MWENVGIIDKGDITMTDRQTKIAMARGNIKAPLVLKNASILNVFTETIDKGDVAICGDEIIGVGDYCGETEVDYRGKIICPGFMDAHIHIESSLVTPLTLARVMAPHGTTTLIADPHELVNVVGAQGMDYFLRATESIPMDVFMMLPSSVPATAFETNGANFTADDMKPFVGRDRVLGLGEVMNSPGVLSGEKSILDKLDLLQDYAIDGHAPGLSGRDLQAYVCAGIQTEHECTTFKEALEKVKAGLYVLVREGSAAQNLDALIEGLVKSNIPVERFLFCSDDRHLDDIDRDGHVDYEIRRAIQKGLSPIKAIKMASYYTAQAYRLRGYGAVAAGYRANLVVLDDLEKVKICDVYHAGHRIGEGYCQSFSEVKAPDSMTHSVMIGEVTADQIAVKRQDKNHVIEVVPGQILTRHLLERVSGGDMFVPDNVYNKLCVVERHRGTHHVQAAPIKGFGIENGALAASVGHDSHNIIVVGDNDADILCAIREVAKMQGGYCIVQQGKVLASLPLPVGGLMSDDDPQTVVKKNQDLIQTAHKLSVPMDVDPLFTLSFLSLPVIPELRLTDCGLFDVNTFSMVED